MPEGDLRKEFGSVARRYLGLFLLAALPRLAYLLVARPPFDSVYWALSDGLLRDGSLAVDGLKLTTHEPLYPLFLAVSRVLVRDGAFAVQWLQVAVASMGALYLYRLAEALTGRPRLATISAVLYAGYPLLVRQAAQPSELALLTTVLIAFSCAFVTAATTAGAALAGVWLGLAVLTRTMMLPLLAFGAAVFLADRRPRAALAFSLATLIVVCPLPIRNHGVNGSWWPTRSGLNLYIGNSPYTAAVLPTDDVDILQEQAQAVVARERPDLSPLAPGYQRVADALLARRALAYMAERPLHTLAQKLWNVLYFFSPRLVPFHVATPETRVVVGPAGEIGVENSEPRPLAEVIAYAASYSFVLVCAVAGVYLRRRDLRRDFMLWCIVVTVVAVHAVYFPASRYMAPIVFVLLFYAGVALDAAMHGAMGAASRPRLGATKVAPSLHTRAAGPNFSSANTAGEIGQQDVADGWKGRQTARIREAPHRHRGDDPGRKIELGGEASALENEEVEGRTDHLEKRFLAGEALDAQAHGPAAAARFRVGQHVQRPERHEPANRLARTER